MLIVLAPIYAVGAAYFNLRNAVSAFDRAETALRTGRGDVEGLMDEAVGSAERGAELMSDPLVHALATITTTGNDLDAALRLADVAGDSSSLGLDVYRTLNEIGPRLYSNGRIDFDVVDELDDQLGSYDNEIAALLSRLGAGAPGTSSFVQDAYDRAAKRLSSGRKALDTARAALAVLPRLFGEATERRYLIAFLGPSEARGGGGIPGVFSVLRVRDGAFELTEISANEPLNRRLGNKTIDAPRWFEHLYGDLTALDDVRQVNLSPSFPATSAVLLDMYRVAYGEKLDGVIAMDPIVLGNLTRPLGSLQASGWDVKIGAGNARRLLMRDIYLQFPHRREKAQNVYLGRLVDQAWGRVSKGDFELATMGAALASSAASQHLKMFSTEPVVQSVLRELGMAGDPRRSAPNVQLFFHNNFAGNKIDYFIDRDQNVTITVDEDGTAHVATEVTMTNDAPLEPVNVLNRPLLENLPVGLARMTTHFMLPRGADVTRVEANGNRAVFYKGQDAGFPVRWASKSLPSGVDVTYRIEYRIPNAIVDDTFRFTLWPQALPFPDRFSIELTAAGEIVEHNFGQANGSTLTSTGTLREPRTFEVELEP